MKDRGGLQDSPGSPGAEQTEPVVPGLEIAVSIVLRAGVILSSLLIAAGTAVVLATPSSRSSARRAIPQLRRGALAPTALRTPHTLAAVFSGVGRGHGLAIVMLGLLLLIATPVLRVMVSVVAFALERDRRFVLITGAVLCVLIGSFAIGG